MKKKMLLIRADANKKIGMGHVMRCLTIAEAAKKRGIETCFLTADDGAEILLKERGQAYHILRTDFEDMEGELPTLFEVLSSYVEKEAVSEPVFLLDSYQITEQYVEKLGEWLSKRNIRLILMEDYGNIPYKADMIINYNIYGVDFSYESNAPKALLGCRYMPLRPEFTRQKYEVKKKVTRLLITTGGSDSYRIAVQLVQQFLTDTELCIHVVCGKFSESREELALLEKQNENVKIHTDVKKMWELMAECDMAVSAAGTTVYELCAVGVPTICFSFADNQRLPGNTFAKYTDIYYAGDYEKDKKAMFAAILEKTTELCSMSKEDREKMSNRLKSMVDGKGAERIVAKIWEGGSHEKAGNEF